MTYKVKIDLSKLSDDELRAVHRMSAEFGLSVGDTILAMARDMLETDKHTKPFITEASGRGCKGKIACFTDSGEMLLLDNEVVFGAPKALDRMSQQIEEEEESA